MILLSSQHLLNLNILDLNPSTNILEDLLTMPSANYQNSTAHGASTSPSRSYEMKSSANADAKYESDDDNTPPANTSSSREALLNHVTDSELAKEMGRRYRDEEREHEFEMREKEEMRMRERAEAQRTHEATMWWVKRATALVALYAAMSIFWLRVWPHLGGGEKAGS